jgi:hypothetical protein
MGGINNIVIFDSIINTILDNYNVTQPWLPKVTGNNILTQAKQPTTNVGYIANNQNEEIIMPRNFFGKRNTIKNKNGTKAKMHHNR